MKQKYDDEGNLISEEDKKIGLVCLECHKTFMFPSGTQPYVTCIDHKSLKEI